MVFKTCSINGRTYGDGDAEPDIIDEGIAFDSSALRADAAARGAQAAAIDEFFRLLAVCHTVVVDKETGGYQASSPDEFALVQVRGRGAGLNFPFFELLFFFF